MKKALVLLCCPSLLVAQSASTAAAIANQAPIATPALTLQLSDAPQPVNSATIQTTGNPGMRTMYYWIVSEGVIGQSTPAGPFQFNFAPNLYSSTQGAFISWTPTNATSYDVLRTTTPVMPSGACDCAVAVDVTGTSVSDRSESLSAYTVSPVDANSLAAILHLKSFGINQSWVYVNNQPLLYGIPTPSAGSLGGVYAEDCADAGGFIQSININGTETCGSYTLPAPTASTLGGVYSVDCSSSSGFVQKINIDGTETCANYTLPNSGVNAGTYQAVTVNAQGIVTAGYYSTTPITVCSNSATSGCTALPGGLILQWATGSADPADSSAKQPPGYQQTISWPTPFPHSCLAPWVVTTTPSTSTSVNWWYQVVAGGVTTNGIEVQRQTVMDDAGVGGNWGGGTTTPVAYCIGN